MKKFLLTFFFIFSCSTPYQKQGFAGGYLDTQLSANTFRVSAAGNAMTSMDRIQNMILLRASEITLEKGYDVFEVIHTSSRITSSVFSQTQEVLTTHTPGQAPSSVTYGGGSSTVHKPQADMTIRILKYSDLNSNKEKLEKSQEYGSKYFIAGETYKYLNKSLKN